MGPIILPKLAWLPSPNVSSRHGTPIELLVLHETAGRYAGDLAWLCNPRAQASAHLVLREDGEHCTQLVKLSEKAWTQGNYNPRCVSLELSNTTAKGYATDRQLRVAARIFGWLLLQYGLPARWARGGHGRGVTFHGNLGPGSGGHPLCGPNGPGWQAFLDYLHHEVARGGYRKSWARL